jgi:hypothetical protein
VITSGTNARQVRTIAEEVEARIKAEGGPGPLRIEGLDDARWVLLDYGDFVVHVFLDEVAATTTSNGCGPMPHGSPGKTARRPQSQAPDAARSAASRKLAVAAWARSISIGDLVKSF